jgi:hypothetical protein
MKKTLLAIILAIVLCSATYPPVMQRTPTLDTTMETAIEDYLRCRLSKPFNVFTVYIDEISEYAPNKINDEVTVIGISPALRKVYITPVDTVGSIRVPTRHIVKDGKLFYWHDPDYGLTEEMVRVFYQFNIADSIGLEDLFATQDERTDDYYIHSRVNKKGKAADYYFCKDDPNNYKRVITNIATGWYKPPKLRCKKR